MKVIRTSTEGLRRELLHCAPSGLINTVTLKVGAIFLLSLLMLVIGASCRSTQTPDANQQYGIVVVNAPAAGEVRRILVSEGTQVSAGAPILEIAVESQAPVAPPPGESRESQAVSGIKSSQAEVEAARSEVVRHEAEVQRLTPLVAAGEASAAQLDGERALYERAQQRLQKAKDAEQQAQTDLRVARQPGAQAGGLGAQQASAPREQIVVARASSEGTVAVISARVGAHVTNGQPLATLRANVP